MKKALASLLTALSQGRPPALWPYSALAIFLLLLGLPAGSTAQPHQRPKVGLVLSGGAAKGMAHVGVLKVLEEVGLEPDIITGTSMGSIIGGLYAIGYRSDTLEQLLANMDWDQVLSDRIDLRNVVFEEKDYFENQLFEIGYQDREFLPPTGLIFGHQIDNLLTSLTLPARNVKDFSQLPIAFRCVAADIVEGQPYPISSGNLAHAMRASMAIPTAFTPVIQDSVILIDGGLIRNFPVQEAKDLGADIIIGVYTGWVKADAKDLENFSTILLQSGFLLSVQDAEAQMPLVDLYIEPDLSGYSAQDFGQAREIIGQGEAAARKALPALRELSARLDQLGTTPPKTVLVYPDSLCFEEIRVEGNQRYPEQEILGKFDIAPGEFYSPTDINAQIDVLMGTNTFEKISFSIEGSRGSPTLVLNCTERPPTLFKMAVNYDNYSNAGFLFHARTRNALLAQSRLSATAAISENYRLFAEYLKYWGNSQVHSTRLLLGLTRDNIPIIQGDIRNEEYRLIEAFADLQFQKRLDRDVMASLGIQYEQLQFSPRVSSAAPFRSLSYNNFNIHARLERNTLDRNIFPTSGTRLGLEVKGIRNLGYRIKEISPSLPLDADSLVSFTPYLKVAFQAESFLPLNERGSVRLRSFAGLVSNPSNTFGDFFLIGAPAALTRRSIPFYGLTANQLVAQVAVGGGLGYQHFFKKNMFYAIDLSTGLFGRPLNFEDTLNELRLFVAGAGVSAGVNTLIGPVKLTLMMPVSGSGQVGKRLRAFLNIGHRF
ncbi:patatin-like phospholipase family protein [Phaeodactylibacter luteus]|uniref:BamA/TamA family outer membrane protein n=1 Tax=Phaeodactylibacter luteus TaxID=1564516 RepID=A0A5C6RMI6_9BACT|nr:patatin-like phospholipase family protein [Phaeodactylibacter luteus]TXB63139.1 BamA/TamA family outer membrane protein [Phaeodactylibacter luteus]